MEVPMTAMNPPYPAYPPPALANPRVVPLLMAATTPIAIGGLVAIHGSSVSPLFAVPAVVFGVTAATSPALYIATAATGSAPPLAAVVRAFGVAIGAFGVALAGMLLPVAFLSLSAVAGSTTFFVASAAIAGAGLLGLRRLKQEMHAARPLSFSGEIVFWIWACATAGIAGRMWWDLAKEVLS
jgi:hypothetical protein